MKTSIVLILMLLAYGLYAGFSPMIGKHVYAAGEAVSWDMEMQRPEARKALKKYVEDNCSVDIWYYDVPVEHGSNGGRVHSQIRVVCLNEK